MLPELHPAALTTKRSVFGLFLVVMTGGLAVLFMGCGTVVFVELLGAIGALEVVAFTGNGEQGSGHEQDGE